MFFSSSKGFSLIEALIGAAILMVSALTIAFLAKSTSPGGARLTNTQEACRGIATNVLNAIREHGSRSSIQAWAPPASPGYPESPGAVDFENLRVHGSGGTNLTRTGQVIVGNANATTPGLLNTHLLYFDAMNVINTLLAQFPAACNTSPTFEGVFVPILSADYGGIADLQSQDEYDRITLRPQMPRITIRPRDMGLTGTPMASCADRARPKSSVVPYREAFTSAPNLSGEYQVTQWDPVQDVKEIGYEVEVRIAYELRRAGDRSNNVAECRVSQVFTYERLSPPIDTLAVSTTNSTVELRGATLGQANTAPPIRSAGNPSTNPASFTSSFTRAENLRRYAIQQCSASDNTTVTATVPTSQPGNILYCRDRSRMRHVPPPGAITLPAGSGAQTHFAYFSNIIDRDPLGNGGHLGFIRHSFAVPRKTGTPEWGANEPALNCDPGTCPSFPPIPFTPSPATMAGFLKHDTYIHSGGLAPQETIITDGDGVTHSHYFYTPDLPLTLPAANPNHPGVRAPMAVAATPHQSSVPLGYDGSNLNHYGGVIASLFGTASDVTIPSGSTVGWVPCHQILGGNSVTSTINANANWGCSRGTTSLQTTYDTTNGTYTFQFLNLKRGCDIVIDVVEVDPTLSLSRAYNDPLSMHAEYMGRRGQFLTTISEYVAERDPGPICYDPATPHSYFFRCTGCQGAEVPLPERTLYGTETF